jgi:molybdate/tungstate transport system ATP-binding protein
VELQDYQKRMARKLSGGEQQRVSLARALALSTDVLLLDEPTANLDPKTGSIIERTIKQANEERETTIIMATHNMFQAESLTHRAALLINGKITAIGTSREIFQTPSEYMASFARLENVFSGKSKLQAAGTSLIDVGDGVQIEGATRTAGRVTLFISPKDIILSNSPIKTSARNMFKGKITEISDLGPIVRLKVQAGKQFTVQITKRSLVEMNINLGSEVYLTFKASSIRTI